MYDLETDILRPFLLMNEIDFGVGGFLPSDIQFKPDGRFMFVANGGIGLDNGPVLEIEVSTKEVTRSWQHLSGMSRLIKVNPKDWAR